MTALNLATIGTTLTTYEQAALKSSDVHVQAFGAALSNAITAFRAAVPGLAATFVNVGIAELAKAEPIFGILIPMEGIIDPAASGLAATLEGLFLPAVVVPVEVPAIPQPQPE